MMKLFTFVIIALALSMSSVYALDLTIGPDTEFIINKDLKLKNLDADAEYSAQYYDVKADVKLGDLIVLSPKAGINTFSAEIGDVDVNGGIGWNIGLDAETKALETKYADLSLIGKYRYSRTDIDSIDIGPLSINNPIEAILSTHEWEIGVMASKDLKELTGLQIKPYVGLVYSDFKGTADMNLSVIGLEEEISTKDHLGVRTGFTVSPIENLNVGVGLKLIDETAITAAASYKF